MDEQRVADAGPDEGALDALVPGHVADGLREVLRVLPVDDGAEHGLVGRERLALDRVPPVRDDVPRHRHRRDPVLADVSGRSRTAGGHGDERPRAEDHGEGAGEGRERERPRPSESSSRDHSEASPYGDRRLTA